MTEKLVSLFVGDVVDRGERDFGSRPCFGDRIGGAHALVNHEALENEPHENAVRPDSGVVEIHSDSPFPGSLS